MHVKDMQKYCCDYQANISKPFGQGEYVVATNGRILVRVRKESVQGEYEPESSNHIKVGEIVHPCETLFAPDDVIGPLPYKSKECSECRGHGRLEACPECEGEGQVTHFGYYSRQEYESECLHCDGTGKIVGDADECEECSGVGHFLDPDAVPYMGCFFRADVLWLLLTIPGLKLSDFSIQPKKGPFYFTFEEGDGIVMPFVMWS